MSSIGLFVLGLAFLQVCYAHRINYRNYHLYKFKPKHDVMEFLHEVEESEENGSYFDLEGNRLPVLDFFAEPNRDQPDAYVLVAPMFKPSFLQILADHKVNQIKLINSDIQSDIDEEKNQDIHRRKRRRRNVFISNGPSELRSFDIFSYNSHDKIVNHLKALSNYKPEMITFYNVTKTFEGRDLVGVKITSPNSQVAKKSMLIDGGIHAREHISIAVSVYMIDRLVMDYENNEKIKWLLDNFDFWIIPSANPDGYEYSRTTDRMWRKTRSKDEKVNKWCYGADANRNWGFRWGQVGATRSPCSSTYAGRSAYSEPEVVGIREFVKENVQNLKVYVSFHAYGQLFLSPWGYTNERPGNYRDQQIAAQYAVNAIRNETGAVYTYGSIAEVMYPASGTSIDYFQSQGVPFVYGVELRPMETSNAGFTIPASEIEPTGREMVAAFYEIGQYVNGNLPKRLFLKRRRQ